MSPADQQRIEQLFLRCRILRMSDLHASNLAAERYEAGVRAKWASALFRCCMHRIQTSEKVLLQGLEQRTESFFSECGIVVAKDTWQLGFVYKASSRLVANRICQSHRHA